MNEPKREDSLAYNISRQQQEDFEHSEKQRAKCGEYTGDSCPNCGRFRVMLGDDNKRRCEKCAWCIEDSGYDGDLLDYLR